MAGAANPHGAHEAPDLVAPFVAALLPLADPARAQPMQAYMKQQFAFLGIATPARRAANLPLIRALKGIEAADLLQLARQLWALPQREYQYCAIDLLASQQKQLTAGDIPALLALAQSKSWWDSVDGLAGIIGDVLLRQHLQGKPAQDQMDQALLAEDFWLRRIAMIHQLGWRAHTDLLRLARYALHLAPEREFFIRKAIGWALRDYAWHDPAWVSAFIMQHRGELSPLSYREAGKNLSH